MSRTAFLQNLWPLILVAMALEVALYLLGERWFGFYGHATTALVIVVPLAWIVSSRYRTLGLKRWPAWLFFALIAVAAIVQIAYWTVFFSSRDQAITLAIGRGMVLERADPFLAWAAILAAALGIWLVARATRRD